MGTEVDKQASSFLSDENGKVVDVSYYYGDSFSGIYYLFFEWNGIRLPDIIEDIMLQRKFKNIEMLIFFLHYIDFYGM